MQLIVISSSERTESEVTDLVKMFENGLDLFHVRKPKFSYRKMSQYLSLIPSEYYNRIIIHSHHSLAIKFNLKGIHLTRKSKKNSFLLTLKLLWYKYKKKDLFVTTSCHKLIDIRNPVRKYNYVFLSPIFESISKPGHVNNFSEAGVIKAVTGSEIPVYALGGITSENIPAAKKLGFKGVAVLGALWGKETDNLAEFIKIKNAVLNITNYGNMKIKQVNIKL
jgi:thiamine-phosphate pyrophosphorylase